MKKLLVVLGLATALAVLVSTTVAADWPVASSRSYISQYPSSRHLAVDIAAPKGSKIMPVWSGTVVYRGWRNNCGGRQVYVRHKDGWYTAYYHLDTYGATVGSYVTKSRSKIGTVGTTGCVTGPNVHIEFWKGYPWRSGSYRVSRVKPLLSGEYLPSRYR